MENQSSTPIREAVVAEIDYFKRLVGQNESTSKTAIEQLGQEVNHPGSHISLMVRIFKNSMRAELYRQMVRLLETVQLDDDFSKFDEKFQMLDDNWQANRREWIGWAATGSWGPDSRVEGAWRLEAMEDVENRISRAISRMKK